MDSREQADLAERNRAGLAATREPCWARCNRRSPLVHRPQRLAPLVLATHFLATHLPAIHRIRGRIRIRPDRRLPVRRLPLPIPAPASKGRPSAEDRYLGSPARANRRAFACSMRRTITTTGSLFTCLRPTAAVC